MGGIGDVRRHSDEVVVALGSLSVLIVYIIKIYDIFLLVSILLRITLLHTLVGLAIILVYIHLARGNTSPLILYRLRFLQGLDGLLLVHLR